MYMSERAIMYLAHTHALSGHGALALQPSQVEGEVFLSQAAAAESEQPPQRKKPNSKRTCGKCGLKSCPGGSGHGEKLCKTDQKDYDHEQINRMKKRKK